MGKYLQPFTSNLLFIILISMALGACVNNTASYQYLHNAKVAIDAATNKCGLQDCLTLQPAQAAYEDALQYHKNGENNQAREAANTALEYAQMALRQ